MYRRVDVSSLILVGSLALLLNSAYLVAAPSASLWYYLQVGLHPLLGITLALALIPGRIRREWATGPLAATGFGALGAGLLLGLTVVALGATRQYAVVLHAHIAFSVVGAGLLLAHVWRTTTGSAGRVWAIRAGLIAVLAAGVTAPMLRATRDAAWQQAYRIENPTQPPASMDLEGAGAASPFAPSSATTNTGETIPADFFLTSEACGRCHRDIYDQWNSSAHHFSSFNNQWYRRSIEYMQDVVSTTPSKWCAGCHDHAVFFNGRFDRPIREQIEALLRGSKTDPQRPLPTDPLTTDSVRRRPTTLSHLIEDVTCEDGLRLLPRPTARSKALPDDQLVPEEGVLHTGLLMVARVLLPLSPSSLLHLSDRAVARGRSWSPSRHGGCPGRWNDDRRATRTRSLVDATRVVGRVRREAGDVAFDRVDQIEGRRRVVNMPAGQGVSDDHARSVDAQMKLLPAAYTASAMFHGRPFTFTHSREPGTVDDEMYACARGEAAKCKVEVLTTP